MFGIILSRNLELGTLCFPLTPITAEDFAQLDTSSSHWVLHGCPVKSRGIWPLCLMRARWGPFATVEATCKGSQATTGSRSPTFISKYPFPYQYVNGLCQELQTHNDLQLGTTGLNTQAAIPFGWYSGTGLTHGSFKKAQLCPAWSFKNHELEKHPTKKIFPCII